MKNIAEILVQHDIVKTNFKKPFIWASGINSPIYCDCRELISIPEARKEITNAFLDLISREKIQTDIVSGTATAGIPWAAFVADKLDKPMLYVRPKPKDHGVGKQVEGRGEKGKNVLIIEDAFSTGGSSIKSAEALRNELNATVEHILAIFSWDTPQLSVNAEKGKVNLWPLTNFAEIAEALEKFEKINDLEFEELMRFHSNPSDWWKK
jgi:orotate phosphoribosyltransferase